MIAHDYSPNTSKDDELWYPIPKISGMSNKYREITTKGPTNSKSLLLLTLYLYNLFVKALHVTFVSFH